MAICCSPHTLHVAPRDALRSCLSVRPSLPPWVCPPHCGRKPPRERLTPWLSPKRSLVQGPHQRPQHPGVRLPGDRGGCWWHLPEPPADALPPFKEGAKPRGMFKTILGGSMGETTQHRAVAEPGLHHGVQWVPQGPSLSWGLEG